MITTKDWFNYEFADHEKRRKLGPNEKNLFVAGVKIFDIGISIKAVWEFKSRVTKQT